MTATKSAEKNATGTAKDALQDALKFYEDALKSGIQLQEESIKLWKDVLSQVGSPEELKAKLESMAKDILPKNTAKVEDIAKVFQDNAQQCTEILSKAIGVCQSSSLTEGQNRMQELVETSLGALRSNVSSVVDTNAQIMKAWEGIFSKK